MRKLLWIAALVSSVVWLSSCIVIVKEEKRVPHEPEVVYISAEGAIEEIDAVGELAFDTDRLAGYKRIAAREGLSDSAQAHLVRAVYEKLSFESAKKEVLLTLIQNPSFGRAAEQAILDQLGSLSFEDTKREILNAIDQRKYGGT